MLLFWVAAYVIAIVQGVAQWEPCNVQCKSTFKSKDSSENSLIIACENGCQIFNDELINTIPKIPNKENAGDNENLSAKSTQKVLKNSNLVHDEVNKIQRIALKTDFTNDDLIVSKLDRDAIVHTAESVPHSTEIATELMSQPVQDRPDESGKTTTSRNPVDKKSLKSEKNNENPLDVQQINRFKHIEKHSPFHLSKKDSTKHLEKRSSNQLQVHFNILKLNSNDNERVKSAKLACCRKCANSYEFAQEKSACMIGCELQATTASISPSEISVPEVPKSPIFKMQRELFGLANNVGKFFKVMWSSMASRFRKPPEEFQVMNTVSMADRMQSPLIFGMKTPTIVQEQIHTKTETVRNQKKGIVEFSREFSFPSSSFREFEMSAFPSVKYSSNHLPRLIAIINSDLAFVRQKQKNHQPSQLIPLEILEKNKAELNTKSDIQEEFGLPDMEFETLEPAEDSSENSELQLDLLECISRKSGLSRWFIAVIIFTSTIIVFWLCLSLTTSSEEVKAVKKPMLYRILPNDDEEFDELEKKLLPDVNDFRSMKEDPRV